MRVNFTNDKGEVISSWKIHKQSYHNLRLLLKEYDDKQKGKLLGDNCLIFNDGLWVIPKNNVNEMYKKIVLAYSSLPITKQKKG